MKSENEKRTIRYDLDINPHSIHEREDKAYKDGIQDFGIYFYFSNNMILVSFINHSSKKQAKKGKIFHNFDLFLVSYYKKKC